MKIEVVLLNLAFALLHPVFGAAMALDSGLIRSVVINLAMFVLPAAGWFDVLRPRSRRIGTLMVRMLALSTTAFFGSIAVLAAFGIEPTTVALWNSLWIASNAGVAIAWLSRQKRDTPRAFRRGELALLAGGSVLAYGLFFWGATQLVPAVEDQDLEVSGTGYSLLTRFEPILLTDRNSVFFFAHPPLLHFYAAGSYALGGALEELRFYFDGSERVRKAWNGQPVSMTGQTIELRGHPQHLPVDPGSYRIAGIDGTDYILQPAKGTPVPVSIESVELDRIYARYLDRPRLIESRSPNLLFAAITVGLLALWAARISRRWWMGLLAAATYATSPEVLVRSSYGGYFAIGGLACVLLLLTADARRRPGSAAWPALLAGAFAGLVDHKLMVLPLALAIGAGLDLRHGPKALVRSVHPALIGFVAGYGLFWIWGLTIASGEFVADHLRHHLVDRITHHNPFGYGGYPSATGLWMEFNAHLGYVLMPVALALVGLDFLRARTVPASLVRQRMAWLSWFALTAIVFTIIDWRMTKHLALLVLPICLALVPDARAPRWRVALPVATFLFVFAINIASAVALFNDFDAFVVTPTW